MEASQTYRVDGGDIDLFLITGPQVRDVVERYTDLTGKSALLPRYALGYLGSSMYYPELEKDCDDATWNLLTQRKKKKFQWMASSFPQDIVRLRQKKESNAAFLHGIKNVSKIQKIFSNR